MIRAIKEFFDGRIHHHDVVLFSSFFYILCAISLEDRDPTVVSFLLLVFLTSIFYHSYPKNPYFRLADWIASLSFIYYIANFIYENNLFTSFNLELLLVLAILSIVSWTVSFFAFLKNHGRLYNVSHTLWHVFGSIIVFLIIFGI